MFLRPDETGRHKICLFGLQDFIVAGYEYGWLVFSAHRTQQWLELWWWGDVGSLSNYANLSGCRWLMWLSLTAPTSSLRWLLPWSFPCWGPRTGSALLLRRWVISSVERWCWISLYWEELVAPTDVLPVPATAICYFPSLSVLLLSAWVLPLSSSCSPKPECLDESVVSAGRAAHSE